MDSVLEPPEVTKMFCIHGVLQPLLGPGYEVSVGFLSAFTSAFSFCVVIHTDKIMRCCVRYGLLKSCECWRGIEFFWEEDSIR